MERSLLHQVDDEIRHLIRVRSLRAHRTVHHKVARRHWCQATVDLRGAGGVVVFGHQRLPAALVGTGAGCCARERSARGDGVLGGIGVVSVDGEAIYRCRGTQVDIDPARIDSGDARGRIAVCRPRALPRCLQVAVKGVCSDILRILRRDAGTPVRPGTLPYPYRSVRSTRCLPAM